MLEITLAQTLLVLLVPLMVADMVLTARGLVVVPDAEEANVVANRLMKRFGNVHGMLVYEGGMLLLVAALVLQFPSQWAFPLYVVGDVLLCIWNNMVVLIKEMPREAEAPKGPRCAVTHQTKDPA